MKKLTGIILLLAVMISALAVSPVLAKTEKEMLDEGEKLIKSQDLNNAVKVYSDIIRQFPDSEEAYINRGQVYFSSGEFYLAIADFTQAIRSNPKSADAYVNRAACFTMIKHYDKAIEDNKYAVGLDPNNDAAYYNLGAVYQLKGDYVKSLAAVDKAISLEPNNAIYLIGRGMVNFCAGNMDKSAEDYKRASQLDTKNRYSRLMYGLALLRQGKDGAGYFKEYLEKNSNTEWPRPVFSMFAENISPEECLKNVLEGNRNEMLEHKCEAYFYIGEFYLIKNDKAKAKVFFEKCLATGVNYFNEYIFSKAELKKL